MTKLVAMATSVTLGVEIVYETPEGKGLVDFEKEVLWPGVPLKGQSYSQVDALWNIHGPLKVHRVGYLAAGDGTIIVHVEFRLWNLTQELSKARERALLSTIPAVKDGVPSEYWFTKAGLEECIEDMLHEGWTMPFPGRWFPAGGKPVESLPDPSATIL